MASREEMSLFRAARSGEVKSQIVLGRRYLFGDAGAPQSIETGLYWLARAARQGAAEACMLIGSHVPLEIALRMQEPDELCAWYEHAFDHGVIQAGLAFARLALSAGGDALQNRLHGKAWRALESAAASGSPEAQWLLAQQLEKRNAADDEDSQEYLEWARRAANNGVLRARRRLADDAWQMSDDQAFLHWALPIARALGKEASSAGNQLTGEDRLLLSRSAQALFRRGDFATSVIRDFAELAARAGDRQAQLCLGMWYAKMDKSGGRIEGISSLINYRMAIQWLTLAGQQGLADAWYVISRIYLKAEFVHRSVTEAERYLDYAAQAGHPEAQLELGKRLWRKRHHAASNDVLAAYWLQRASAQGSAEAGQLLRKITSRVALASWARSIRYERLFMEDPLLAAQIMLVAYFGLSKHEALLLNVCEADHGHCLLVDLRGNHVRTKRRLILVRTGEERRVLDDIKRAFERVPHHDAHEVEATYRQQLYRLETVLASCTAPMPHERIPGKRPAGHSSQQHIRRTPRAYVMDESIAS